jgi:hypothetical protein
MSLHWTPRIQGTLTRKTPAKKRGRKSGDVYRAMSVSLREEGLSGPDERHFTVALRAPYGLELVSPLAGSRLLLPATKCPR